MTFENFIQENSGLLRHVAHRAMPRERGDSNWEDAYQGALMRAWLHWSRGIRDKRRLCNQATWGALDARRVTNGRSGVRPGFVELEKVAYRLARDDDPMLRARLSARLELLSERQRRVVMLYMAGHSLKEIGDELGVTSSAIHGMRGRAIEIMKEIE